MMVIRRKKINKKKLIVKKVRAKGDKVPHQAPPLAQIAPVNLKIGRDQ